MALADQIRLRISDRWRFGEEVRYGDGTASQFKLAQGAPFSNVSALSGFLSVAAGWSAFGTASAVDTGLGLYTVTAVPSANVPLRFAYQWAVFSDAEIAEFAAAGGGVPGAALQAVRTLMFDSLRRAKWRAPDGTEFDDTAAMRQLLAMEERLLDELERSDGPQGGIESWGDQQGNYGGEYSA